MAAWAVAASHAMTGHGVRIRSRDRRRDCPRPPERGAEVFQRGTLRASERRKRQRVRNRGGGDADGTFRSRLIECSVSLLSSATEGHVKGVPRHARHLPAVAPLGGGEDVWQLIAHEGLEGHLGVPLAPDGIEHNGAIARHCALNIGQPEAGEGRELLEWIGLGLGLGSYLPYMLGRYIVEKPARRAAPT